MSEPTRDKSNLPRLTEEDISVALYEEIIDSSHMKRFDYLMRENPVLMREIVRRAYVDAYSIFYIDSTPLESALNLQKVVIDSVTFAVDAIDKTIERRKETGTNGDAYAEDRLRSNEPDDDQPTA